MKVELKPSSAEYQTLFDEMVIDTSKQDEINEAVALIKQSRARYQNIAYAVNSKIPYYAIGIAHYMECDCNFNEHIHCGDSLQQRTIHEPIGRPLQGNPPFTWEESCTDWLNMKGWNKWQDWGITDILSRLEMNNGLGYRHLGVPTPYLWSYTNIYVAGKFVNDGQFNPNAVSKQVGAAILLKELL